MASTRSTPFGELLRRARKAAGLTQAELAERAGLSWRGINDLERGVRQTPRRDTLALLAQALDLSDKERTAFEDAARHSSGQSATAMATPALPEAIWSETAAPPTLPTGTVTFLFTDIEGSTHLLQQLGARRYATLRDTHHRLLRAACAAHGGREVDTAGDSTFLAFPTAADAVAAAIEAQRALATERWPAGVTVRVRMGLHTGAPLVAGDHYVGLDVHRAARIGAAGHGGQVLLSQTTADLALDVLPEGAMLRDLGAHQLKDLQRPEHLWQLVVLDGPGLAVDYPSLGTLDAHPHNLPLQPTPLIGREREVATVCALLRRNDVRLVTLTGTGGTGKTRLALQVAAELVEVFADGVWFVGLSRLVDSALVLPTIAQTLGVREVGGQPIALTLSGYLHTKQVLVVLDNFEQVAVAASAVAELLQSCARLKVLVTSRVALHLRGEKQYRVPPLPLPDPAHGSPLQDLVQYGAVALFVQRAQDADATFALSNATVLAIAAICARLDGLPLAIVLAAAKVRVLPPPALLVRLERQLPLLVGGARDVPARQQTMRNTLAWSEELLSLEHQRLFRRLAVFVGGFTLEAAEAVCAAPDGAETLGVNVLEGLEALVDQSLVQPWMVDSPDGAREGSDEARFRLLIVVREYALERLEVSGEAEALRRAHAAYFLMLAEQGFWQKALDREGAAWLARLEREHDNCRAALTWACERQEVALCLRLGAALATFWNLRGYWREGRAWLEELLVLGAGPTSERVEGEQRWEEVQRRWGLAAVVSWAWVLGWAGSFASAQGDVERAMPLLEEALVVARLLGMTNQVVVLLGMLGSLALEAGEVVRGVALIEESLVQARRLSQDDAGDLLNVLGRAGATLLQVSGEEDRAEALEEEALELAQRVDKPYYEAGARSFLALIALRRGDLARAGEQAVTALRVMRDQGMRAFVPLLLDELAIVAGREGQGERAARLLGAAGGLCETMGYTQESALNAEIEDILPRIQAVLGEAGWAVAFTAGQALSLEDAIAEALGKWE